MLETFSCFSLQFAHLIRIQKRLGKDVFPLIEQSYFPNHKEMVSNMWVSHTSLFIFLPIRQEAIKDCSSPLVDTTGNIVPDSHVNVLFLQTFFLFFIPIACNSRT